MNCGFRSSELLNVLIWQFEFDAMGAKIAEIVGLKRNCAQLRGEELGARRCKALKHWEGIQCYRCVIGETGGTADTG